MSKCLAFWKAVYVLSDLEALALDQDSLRVMVSALSDYEHRRLRIWLKRHPPSWRVN